MMASAYARGEMLSEAQTAAAPLESDPGNPAPSLSEVAEGTYASINRALDQLRDTSCEKLLVPRKVGRAGLPSTTLGLLFHAAEHSTRHAGQAISTAKILANANARPPQSGASQ